MGKATVIAADGKRRRTQGKGGWALYNMYVYALREGVEMDARVCY